jgi:predicted membrane-bound spermidine synthase
LRLENTGSEDRRSRQTSARVALPFLLLLSGFCGISYEILYTKLLGNLLGNQFIINATVLLTFLLGIGLGTLYAHRFLRFLWAIEAGIGAYAALVAIFQAPIDRFVFAQIPFLGTNIAACALVAFGLLALPASWSAAAFRCSRATWARCGPGGSSRRPTRSTTSAPR